jgi:hypothetical protein
MSTIKYKYIVASLTGEVAMRKRRQPLAFCGKCGRDGPFARMNTGVAFPALPVACTQVRRFFTTALMPFAAP